MYNSRSETGGPCATQSVIVIRNGLEGDSPKRLTTALVGSSGDVVERTRKERMVDLHGYHDAVDGVKRVYVPED